MHSSTIYYKYIYIVHVYKVDSISDILLALMSSMCYYPIICVRGISQQFGIGMSLHAIAALPKSPGRLLKKTNKGL